MTKYNLITNMIGYKCPFFLNNSVLTDSHYLYEFFSPGIDEKFRPYLSLDKISERTKSEPNGHGSDILSICLGSKKDIETAGKDYLNNMFKRDGYIYESNGREFPVTVIQDDEESNYGKQKALVVGLRDALRWKLYKFSVGRFVDILWTPKEFVVFEICGDKDSIWLEPRSAYKTEDVGMINPIDIKSIKLDYPKNKFTGNNKASELNRAIKRLEWDSFNRKPIVK